MSKLVNAECDQCGKNICRYVSQIKNCEHLFCNKNCKAIWQSLNRRGENASHYGPNPKLQGKNNPNYGNRWSQEQKDRASIIVSRRYEDLSYRYNIGKSNRGKKLSDEIRTKMSEGHKGKPGFPHSKQTKKLIGKKSKAKFTSLFKKKQRKIMEERGLWMPIDEKKVYSLYFDLCNWKQNMVIYMTDEELELLNTIKFFSHKNTKGMVRDHKYSRLSGFKNKVYPSILRHPTNCQLITQAENISKAHRGNRYEDSDDISLRNLFWNIKIFNKEWFEQQRCLSDITKYKKGEKVNDQFIRDEFRKEALCSSQ